MAQSLKGTGVALITPFTKSGEVDHDALANLTRFVIKGGIDFLVALGTTAETPTLTLDEQAAVLDTITSVAHDAVPIVVGIAGNNTASVVHTIKNTNLSAFTAILSATPYYNKPSQEGLYQHYKALAEATKKPIILYNVPGRTGCNMLPATAIRLAKDFNNIIGIKEASGNMAQCMELIMNKPAGFLVFSGDDNLVLPQMAIGMDGVISVAANAMPKEMCDIVNLMSVNKADKARKVHYKLLPAIDMMFAEGNPVGIKCILSELGMIQNALRLPLVPASTSLQLSIQKYLAQLSA